MIAIQSIFQRGNLLLRLHQLILEAAHDKVDDKVERESDIVLQIKRTASPGVIDAPVINASFPNAGLP